MQATLWGQSWVLWYQCCIHTAGVLEGNKTLLSPYVFHWPRKCSTQISLPSRCVHITYYDLQAHLIVCRAWLGLHIIICKSIVGWGIVVQRASASREDLSELSEQLQYATPTPTAFGYYLKYVRSDRLNNVRRHPLHPPRLAFSVSKGMRGQWSHDY